MIYKMGLEPSCCGKKKYPASAVRNQEILQLKILFLPIISGFAVPAFISRQCFTILDHPESAIIGYPKEGIPYAWHTKLFLWFYIEF